MYQVSEFLAEQHATSLLSALSRHAIANLADTFFPEDGPFARALYPKHMEAIAGTARSKVFSIFGGNRSGKTTLMMYIAMVWLTGKYPSWWNGKRFDKPIKMWVCGQTSTMVVSSLQKYLVGMDCRGGLINGDDISDVHWSPSAVGMASTIRVKHEPTGMYSELIFKTYDMGWKRFQADTIDVSILDEEPPWQIFSESVTRTATTSGVVLVGFTALSGVTPLVAHLCPQFAGNDEDDPEVVHRGHVFIGWDDIPYSQFPKAERERTAAQYLPQERQARINGIPQHGRGLVYPVSESQFIYDPGEVFKKTNGVPPAHWPRICAIDPGGTPNGDGRTAALWCAHDPESDTLYAYSEHYQEFAPIPVHINAIAKRGNWIPILVDPAGASVIDGRGVFSEYESCLRQLNPSWAIHKADKRKSLGRAALYGRLQEGGFKVSQFMKNFLSEHRQHIINENGKWVGPCHLLDCARYIVQGIGHASLKPHGEQSNNALASRRFF